METTNEADYIIVYDENDQPVKRPRNLLSEKLAALQAANRGKPRLEWPPLITIKGEPLSETVIRERRGDFD